MHLNPQRTFEFRWILGIAHMYRDAPIGEVFYAPPEAIYTVGASIAEFHIQACDDLSCITVCGSQC